MHFNVKTNSGWSYVDACIVWDNGDSVQSLKLMTMVKELDWNTKLTSRWCGGDPPIIYLLKSNKLEKFKVLLQCPYVDLTCQDRNGDGLEKIARYFLLKTHLLKENIWRPLVI